MKRIFLILALAFMLNLDFDLVRAQQQTKVPPRRRLC
jgi:hypothetical protein